MKIHARYMYTNIVYMYTSAYVYPCMECMHLWTPPLRHIQKYSYTTKTIIQVQIKGH